MARLDKFKHGGKSALNEQEQRGMNLFFGEKADCFHCHIGFNFTNNAFRNNGLYTDYADSGRMRVTENPNDMGKFKVPTLRNIALTAPYMHDGSLATLEEVLDHYIDGGRPSANIDPLIHPPARLQLVTMLTAVSEAEFATLRDALEVSDSVLSKHVSVLAEAHYVTSRKGTRAGKRTTWIKLTPNGRKAVATHVAALRRLIDGVDTGTR